MSTNIRAFALAACLVLSVASCAGDGTGLDEFGNPLGISLVELSPTLASIQANIFTPVCIQCHTGASAPLGLVLTEGVAWSNLVNVTSVQDPTMNRVNPGSAESSYLVWKVEGRPGIGGSQMPRGLAPLSAEEISAIRSWVDGGAAAN
jgi:mono/diheme cytochrome c family protein